MTSDDGRPLILFVCTGNICRSPAAELLLAAVAGGCAVRSAGTAGLEGRPVQPEMAVRLEAAGISTGGFAARRLTPGLLRPAGLVLTMTREHRAATVELWPAAVRRTFMLAELARLLAAAPPTDHPTGPLAERLPALAALAAAQRRQVGCDPTVDDIADPYRRGDAAYGRAYEQITRTVAVLAPLLQP